MFNFVCLSLKRWFQFNSRNVRTHFASTMALNNWEIIAERRGYIFRWRSRCRRGLVCLSSLFPNAAMTALTVTGFSLSFGVDGLAVKVGSCQSSSLYFISRKSGRLNTSVNKNPCWTLGSLHLYFFLSVFTYITICFTETKSIGKVSLTNTLTWTRNIFVDVKLFIP